LLRVSFIRPVVAFVYGFALFRIPSPPTRFPADLPLHCKAPRPERPIPPQTTHASFSLLPFGPLSGHDLLSSPSLSYATLEDPTTLHRGREKECESHVNFPVFF
jgi:hypothetical protein